MCSAIKLNIKSLAEIDDSFIGNFSCGIEPFDIWFRDRARTDDKRSACKVHICIDNSDEVVAFFTLSSTSLKPAGLTRSLQGGMSNFIPATLLGKLGVRSDLHGRGYGSRVLAIAKEYAREAAGITAARLLIVDAKTTDLVPWYEARGFTRIPDTEKRLVFKL